jgi:chemotaxis-related protein WspD
VSADQSHAGHGPDGESVSIADGVDICWQRIGIFGNATCPELPKVIHCRNCPVYSLAAHRLLDRPVPEEYRREWSVHYAQEEKAGAPARSSAVLFRLGDEWLAFPTEAFQEVAERRQVHSLPHQRDGMVRGLVNIRGELLICVSLARLLGIEPSEWEANDCLICERFMTVAWEGSRLVFPVNEVHGVERFHLEELRAPPAALARSSAHHARGIFLWQDKPVGLLDPAAIFNSCHRSLS